MASSVDPVSQSAIPGYRLSALVCILVCLIRFRGRDEETTSSRNCCIADGNIGIGPINQSCGWLLRWRWDVCRKSLLLIWDYVRHPSVPGQNFEKSSARAGYTRLQGIPTLRTAEAAVKKLLLTGIATLLLTTGAAHATEDFCAVVLKNRDGWLALREGSGTRFKIIAKLLEGDYLLADTGAGGYYKISKKWTHIVGVPRLDGASTSEKTHEDYTRGWVHRKYIQWFACPEDQETEGDSRKRQELPPR
jgi:hypothetical protein